MFFFQTDTQNLLIFLLKVSTTVFLRQLKRNLIPAYMRNLLFLAMFYPKIYNETLITKNFILDVFELFKAFKS
jgi:hypothetical protein